MLNTTSIGSNQPSGQWPPVAIIGLVTLLATIILAPLGWLVQRHVNLPGETFTPIPFSA